MFSWSLVHPYHNWRTEEYSHNFIDICFIIPYNKVAVRGRVRGGARGTAEEVQPWSTPQDVRVSCRATIASSRVCVGATLLMSSLADARPTERRANVPGACAGCQAIKVPIQERDVQVDAGRQRSETGEKQIDSSPSLTGLSCRADRTRS